MSSYDGKILFETEMDPKRLKAELEKLLSLSGQMRSMLSHEPYSKSRGGSTGYQGAVSVNAFVEDVPESFEQALKALQIKRDLDVLDEKAYYEELAALRDRFFWKGTDKWWEYEQEIYEYRKGKQKEFLEFQRDTGMLSEREYYDALEAYRDQYFAVGSSDWLSYTKDIYNYHTDNVKKAYDELLSYAEERLEDVLEKQSRLTEKLKDEASFFRTVVIHNAGENGEDYTFTELKDWDYDLNRLKAYNDAVTAAKERVLTSGIDAAYAASFVDSLLDLSVEEGAAFAKALNDADEKDFLKHMEGYAAYQKESERVGYGQYAQEAQEARSVISSVEEEAKAALKDVKDSFFAGVTASLEEAGLTVPQGFFAIGSMSAEEFEQGFLESIPDLYRAFADGVYQAVANGEVTKSTTYKSFAPVYNFYGNEESTTARIQAAQQASERDRLSGGY